LERGNRLGERTKRRREKSREWNRVCNSSWCSLVCCGFASDLPPLFSLCSCSSSSDDDDDDHDSYHSSFPFFPFPSFPHFANPLHRKERERERERSFILFQTRNCGLGQQLLRIVSESHCIPLRQFKGQPSSSADEGSISDLLP
jgi:hypothetical protein